MQDAKKQVTDKYANAKPRDVPRLSQIINNMPEERDSALHPSLMPRPAQPMTSSIDDYMDSLMQQTDSPDQLAANVPVPQSKPGIQAPQQQQAAQAVPIPQPAPTNGTEQSPVSASGGGVGSFVKDAVVPLAGAFNQALLSTADLSQNPAARAMWEALSSIFSGGTDASGAPGVEQVQGRAGSAIAGAVDDFSVETGGVPGITEQPEPNDPSKPNRQPISKPTTIESQGTPERDPNAGQGGTGTSSVNTAPDMYERDLPEGAIPTNIRDQFSNGTYWILPNGDQVIAIPDA